MSNCPPTNSLVGLEHAEDHTEARLCEAAVSSIRVQQIRCSHGSKWRLLATLSVQQGSESRLKCLGFSLLLSEVVGKGLVH